MTSSSVARNASTSWCGSLWMKPTVSVTIAVCPSPSLTWRRRGIERGEQLVLGQGHHGADERVEQRRLAGVRVADDRRRSAYRRRSRPRAVVSRCWRTSSTALLHLLDPLADQPAVRLQLDSPGPRDPMPPCVRDRCVHRRVRRGSWYSSWASSTWSRPSCVRACRAKMSRISRLRSMTLTLSRLSSDLLLGRARARRRRRAGRTRSRTWPETQLLGLALAHVPVRIDVAAVLPLGAHHFGARPWRPGWRARRGESSARPARHRNRCRRRRGTPSRRAARDRWKHCVTRPEDTRPRGSAPPERNGDLSPTVRGRLR